jgi:hypothetical protein
MTDAATIAGVISSAESIGKTVEGGGIVSPLNRPINTHGSI